MRYSAYFLTILFLEAWESVGTRCSIAYKLAYKLNKEKAPTGKVGAVVF